MRGRILFSVIALGLIAVVFLFFTEEHSFEFVGSGETVLEKIVETVEAPDIVVVDPNADIENQKPLANPPEVVKAIYVTGYAAGSASKMAHINDVVDSTEINAIVLDVKDYTGMVSYENDIPLVNEYKAFERRIPKINKFIKDFHDRGVYMIARIAVFQDQALVEARPDLALQSSSTGAVWRDYKKVAWLDTASKEVWDYNIAIAKDALARGFDEINFDYIRFASDGNLKDIKYPFFDETTLKHDTVGRFFAYVREQLPEAKLSADLFGLVTETYDGMGIGQVLEDAMKPFDVIAPMAYPSHYAKGYRGFDNPAAYPYEVMKFSTDSAVARLKIFNAQIAQSVPSSTPSSEVPRARSTFRPWIQDFDLGADYDASKVRAQIQAIYDAGCEAAPTSTPRFEPCSEHVDGWYVWNPSNVYTKEAFLKE